MYITLKKKFLEKNKASMLKESIEICGDDGKDDLMWSSDDKDDSVDELSFKDGTLTIGVSNDLGYFSRDFELDDDLCMEIVKHLRKKGEKIRRLLELASEP